MKRFYIAALAVALLSSVTMTGQEKKDTSAVDPKPSFAGFVTNGFWDNWELSVGGGIGAALFGNENPGAAGDYIGGMGSISATKWLNPVFGLRAVLEGGGYSSVNAALEKKSWPYLSMHADFMMNLSNWIGGYKERRVYYAVPYFGMGYMASNFTKTAQEANDFPYVNQNFVVSWGLLNKFRVSNSVDVNLEIGGLLGKNEISPVRDVNSGPFLTSLNASVGISYRFGKRDFERGAAGYTMDDINALKAEAARAAERAQAQSTANEDLSDELAQAQKDAAAAQQRAGQAEKQLADAQAELEALKQQIALDAATPEETIFFGYEVWGLDAVDLTTLQELAKKMLAGPKDYVYTITGYADFTTGARSNNIAIAEKRAKSVYDYLVSLGVPAAQLTHQGAGPDAQPFTGRGNQSVTIK